MHKLPRVDDFDKNEVEVQGEAPTPEELAKQKEFLHKSIKVLYNKLEEVEHRILTTDMSYAMILENHAIALKISGPLQWLQGINRNRFTIPETQAMAAEQAKKKIIE